MQLVEVRCCCEPTKLLGHVPVPIATELRPGMCVTFKLTPLEYVPALNVDTLTLKLEEWAWGDQFGRGDSGLAFKSDDTPLDRLRRIRGWVDAGAAT